MHATDSSKRNALPLMPFSPLLRLAVLFIACTFIGGCYYLQAARGQLEVLNKREPIDAVIEDPDTPDEVAQRLELLRAAREFSVTELRLPDNKSYRTFSDLDRDYVVWNVIAAPELSVEPRTWCFPVAGCVAYRGYFSEEKAWRKAGKLAADGYDIFVGGATAYSTLGNFNDPVLSTMLSRDDTMLVALLFHELAHQVLYVKGDTSFNESFATAVEELGIERWLEREGTAADFERWKNYKAWSEDLTRLALEARDDLEALFASDLDSAAKRASKADRLDALTAALVGRAREAGIDASGWWQDQPLNNARLASWSAYESYVPAFRQLFADCGDHFECLYDRAAELADLPPDKRALHLQSLAARIAVDAQPSVSRSE